MSFYKAELETVVFDSLTKETMLFVSFSAAIINVLQATSEKLPFAYKALKTKSQLSCDNDIVEFDQALEQLIDMNIIETVEC